MVIDFHTHCRVGQGAVDELVRAMDASAVDMAVLHPIEPAIEGIGAADTQWVVEQAKRFPDRLVPFASVNPVEADASKRLLHAVERLGCRGLKLHPPVQGFSLDDPRVDEIIGVAESLTIPILVHTGPIFVREARLRSDVSRFDDWALRHPGVTIVLAHGDPLGDAAVLAGKHPNVYIDTAVVMPRLAQLLPGLLENTVQWISTGGEDGAGKIVFGSDANPLKPERLRETARMIRRSSLEPAQIRRILGGTAAAILHLGPHAETE